MVRLAAAFWWQSRLGEGQKFFFGDSEGYWVLGQAIARGDPYQFASSERQIFRTPGYPILLAGLFRMVGDDPPVIAARALGAVLGTLAVALVGCWTWLLFDRAPALWAGGIAASIPAAWQ